MYTNWSINCSYHNNICSGRYYLYSPTIVIYLFIQTICTNTVLGTKHKGKKNMKFLPLYFIGKISKIMRNKLHMLLDTDKTEKKTRNRQRTKIY